MCRWYFDFQLPSEVLEKRPSSRENLRTAKTYTVLSVFWRNLVTHKVHLVHTVTN